MEPVAISAVEVNHPIVDCRVRSAVAESELTTTGGRFARFAPWHELGVPVRSVGASGIADRVLRAASVPVGVNAKMDEPISDHGELRNPARRVLNNLFVGS